MLAAANSGIDFSTPPEDQPTKREIIEILDDKDDDILDQLINEESIQQQNENKLPKIEEDEEEEISEKAVKGKDDFDDRNETILQTDSIKTTRCM